MNQPDKKTAREIIDIVGANGIPPENGAKYFTVGLDTYLSVIEKEYLASFIKDGGSSFKMVLGVYGSGKTHFLYNVREIAWKHNFVVSYVELNPDDSPFYKLELVYQAIVKRLVPPLTPEERSSGYEKGIDSLLRSWFSTEYQKYYKLYKSNEEMREVLMTNVERIVRIESISFAKAIKSAFEALLDNREQDFLNVCQWLRGEGYNRWIHNKFGILQKIDKTTAFAMIRSLLQWIREIGYSGLIIIFDEAERLPSLSSKYKEQHLNNLRVLIDHCGHTDFNGAMLFYAVPDTDFLDGKTQIYEALKQRVNTVFDEMNPTGVKIDLEKIEIERTEFLKNVGLKLKNIYEIAYDYQFVGEDVVKTIDTIAKWAYDLRHGDQGYTRLFVQKCIEGFHFLRNKGYPPSNEDLKIKKNNEQ
ncbi:MAG: BREX system ATP-binding domain-containing protein [Candidatus Kapaibacteriota bacterium]